ncbi:hypothetical protein [Bacillus piscicola]|uniref:hypothetical protein n=1 Tax=Bacillus piscicola TaxID=1632684 RepID=UPI001F08A22A|nr:hypothetical protein [Bacillus piscicola]
MIRLQGGIYYTSLYGREIKLVYLHSDVCKLYINEKYVGLCNFGYIREKVKLLQKRNQKGELIYPGSNVWTAAKKGAFISVSYKKR